MSKLSGKDITKLKREAERGVFMLQRHLQPGTIAQLAKFTGDQPLLAVCEKAVGKKASSQEWGTFMQACTPTRIIGLCTAGLEKLARLEAQAQAAEPEAVAA